MPITVTVYMIDIWSLACIHVYRRTWKRCLASRRFCDDSQCPARTLLCMPIN